MGLVTGDGLKLSHSASCQCGLVIWREGRHPWRAAVAKLVGPQGGTGLERKAERPPGVGLARLLVPFPFLLQTLVRLSLSSSPPAP